MTKTEINFRRVSGLLLDSVLAASLILALPAQRNRSPVSAPPRRLVLTLLPWDNHSPSPSR